MFEFGFILRAKCSGSSKFDLPMFGEFEVLFFDVRSTSNKNPSDQTVKSQDEIFKCPKFDFCLFDNV